MRRISWCVMILLFVGSIANAAPTLRLTSSADLQALRVNQTVTFEVYLSGLESDQELDSLGATISYSDHLISSTITLGDIIPSSGDVFPDASGPISVLFMAGGDESTDRIRTPAAGGLFFSFDVVVQHRLGQGSLVFDYADASQAAPTSLYYSSSDDEYPLYCYCGPATGSTLEFNVVPEPSQWVLMMAAGLGAAAYFLMRRKSAAFVR